MAELQKLVTSGHLGKPDGIRIAMDETFAGGGADKVWTFAELDALAQAHRSVTPAEGEAHIHIVYVDGHYEDDDGSSLVLGFAWGARDIVMLADNVDRACEGGVAGLLPGLGEKLCRISEQTVLLHEMGHLFGLVDNGLAMVTPHKDAEHGAHDTDENCIMYWLNDRSSVADLLAERLKGGDESVSPFDARCLEDLKAAQ